MQELRDQLERNELPAGCDFCAGQICAGLSWPLAERFDRLAGPTPRADNRGVGHPSRMEFELSNKCNLECIMCDVWRQPNRLYDASDLGVVGRDDDFGRAAALSLPRDPHDHRHAGDFRERFTGKARRRVARRDDGDELQTSSSGGSLRASSSSMTGMSSVIG